MTDMQSQRSRLSSELRNFEQSVSESALGQEVNNLAQQIQNLPAKLQTIRQQHYAFAADLEKIAGDVSKQWQAAQEDIVYRVQRRSQRLLWDLSDLQAILNRLNTADDPTMQNNVQRIDGEISRLRTEIQNTKLAILQPAGTVPDQVRGVTDRVAAIEKYLKHAQEASFQLNANESLFIAVEAEWKKGKDKKENPDGVLFITNQRLIMEENEKKGGFMGVGGNKVQQLLWDMPLTAIQGVTSENKGLFGNVDLVHIKTSSGSPAPEVIVEVKDVKADWFVNQLQRAVRGELEQERVPAAS